VNVLTWTGHVTSSDVGALVYYLRAVPWIVPGFSVATHQESLLRLQQRLDAGQAVLTFPMRLYLIEAKRGLDRRTGARQIVAEGYDRIAETYATWSRLQVVDEVRPRYTSVLLEGLPPGARLLELGCGGGGPSTRQLAERFALTGVDISATQVAMARHNVPTATFLHQDMLTLDFGAETFDGVAAFYTLTHLPYGELPGFLRKMGGWVRAGGLLVATLSAQPNWGQVEPDWLGAPMYFSGYSVKDNTRFVEEAGFEVRSASVATILEDGRPVAFLWIVAEKRPLDRQKTNGLFRKIDSVQIPVPDLEAGLAFYRDQLGHELIWRTSTSAGLRMPETDAELVLQTQREQMETDL
jgi:predicted TPR repeat methyltransferase